jgi:hypothetical protein
VPGPPLAPVSRAHAISSEQTEAPAAPVRSPGPLSAAREDLAAAGASLAALGDAAAAGAMAADEYLMSMDRRQVRGRATSCLWTGGRLGVGSPNVYGPAAGPNPSPNLMLWGRRQAGRALVLAVVL